MDFSKRVYHLILAISIVIISVHNSDANRMYDFYT